MFSGDGPDIPGGGHLHPRPHHQRHCGQEGLRRHGGVILSGQQHLRRDSRVSGGHTTHDNMTTHRYLLFACRAQPTLLLIVSSQLIK